MNGSPPTYDQPARRTNLHSFDHVRPTRELRQIEFIANFCVRPRDNGKRPDVVDGVGGQTADAYFPPLL